MSLLLGAAPTRTSGRRGVLRPAGAVVAVAAGVALVAGVDPNEAGHYPTCPFLAVTGLYCPGCGTLRAVHDLAHGDVLGALARNPLAVVAVGVAMAAVAFWFRRAWLGVPRTRDLPPRVLYAAVVVIVGFTLLRNVPGWTWLSPA